MSDVVTELIRRGLPQPKQVTERGPRGIPQVSVGRTVTAEDVRSLDDDA